MRRPLAIAALGVIVLGPASAQELRAPPGVTPGQIAGSSASGRAVLTGTGTQGATALGVGPGNTPTFAGATLNGGFQTRGAITNGGYIGFGLAGDTGLQYWGWGLGDALGGGNSGANLKLFTYKDDGGFLSAGMVINRATSQVQFFGPVVSQPYTVTTLPSGTAGATIYVSNARKVGEAAGAGTGLIAYFSNGSWRRQSDDAPVTQ